MKVTPNKLSGRLGMNYVERVALKAGCKPIVVPEDLDTGIDGFIEFADGERISLIAFQVKHGSSFFDKRGAKHNADPRHWRYWMNYPLPVILVLVHANDIDAFWMMLVCMFETIRH